MTVGNYVRNLSGPGSVVAHGTAGRPHGALYAGCCGLALLNQCLYARKSSPGGVVSSRKCEKVRPAHSKSPKFGAFALAGRVFSRQSRWRGCAGRIFSRQAVLRPALGGDAAHFGLAAMGVLRYMKPSCCVSPACRGSNVAIPPAWWWRALGSRWWGRLYLIPHPI